MASSSCRNILLVMFAVVLMLDVKADTNRDEWIDPNDMLNFDPASGKMLNAKKIKVDITEDRPDEQKPEQEEIEKSSYSTVTSTPNPLTSTPSPPANAPLPVTAPREPQDECREQASMTLMRRYIKSLLKHFEGKEPGSAGQEYSMLVFLTSDEYDILSRFASSGNPKHIHDAQEVLSGMTQRIYRSHLTNLDKTTIWIEEKIGISLQKLIQVLGLFTMASILAFVEMKIHISWRRRLGQLFFFAFFISFLFTYYDLYKQAEIKQHTATMKDIPKECQQEGASEVWTMLKSWVLLQEDKCEKYHEHLAILPIIKVPPTKAIAVTFVRFFLAPMKDIGTSMSEFIKALLVDLPVTYHPVAIAMVGMFLFLILFMIFGYSIRLPFFISIEPGQRAPALAVNEGAIQQAITDNNQQVLRQLEDLQKHIEASETNMMEKVLHLQRVQQTAIEYAVSSAPSSPSSPACAPTIPRAEPTPQPSAASSSTSAAKADKMESFTILDTSSDSGTEVLPESRVDTVLPREEEQADGL